MAGRCAEAELPSTIDIGGLRYATTPLLEADEIQTRVGEMGAELSDYYTGLGGVHVLTVMNGALHFASDLRRAMQAANPTLPLTSDQVKVSSYGGGMQSSGVLRFQVPPTIELKNRHVLVVEDILDSGLTLDWLTNYLLRGHDPASVEVAVALQKDNPERPADLLGNTVMHAGFKIGDEFVVGYGMDINEQLRDLSGVHVLKPQGAAVPV